VHYLQRYFDLTKARLVGASAGALTAALAGAWVGWVNQEARFRMAVARL
jgi:hypothetical protein